MITKRKVEGLMRVALKEYSKSKNIEFLGEAIGYAKVLGNRINDELFYELDKYQDELMK